MLSLKSLSLAATSLNLQNVFSIIIIVLLLFSFTKVGNKYFIYMIPVALQFECPSNNNCTPITADTRLFFTLNRTIVCHWFILRQTLGWVGEIY